MAPLGRSELNYRDILRAILNDITRSTRSRKPFDSHMAAEYVLLVNQHWRHWTFRSSDTNQYMLMNTDGELYMQYT